MTPIQSLISKSLKQRHSDVCERLLALPTSSDFANKLNRHFQSPNLSARRDIPETWLNSQQSCLLSLQALALDESIELSAGVPEMPRDEFYEILILAARNPEQRFVLLTTEYSFPLNFLHPSEEKIREHVLERLMVQDRAVIERKSFGAVESDDLFLRLNLIAIQAAISTDLRFIDALNYYYELLPSSWYPASQHPWLLNSFLALYAKALTPAFVNR